jgi:hypothetical protein
MNSYFTNIYIKILRQVVIISAFSAAIAMPAFAQSQEDKATISSQAIEICESEAKSRYGEDSIKKIGSRAKWSNGLNGSAVKMKIKARSNKPSKYSCVVGLDKSVIFYKA